jgi:hypothetical protein
LNGFACKRLKRKELNSSPANKSSFHCGR